MNDKTVNQQNIKIAIIRPHYSVLPAQYYNSQEIGLAKSLALRGYNVDVICIGEDNKYHYDNILTFEKGTVNKVNLPYKKLPLLDLISFPNLDEFLLSQQYDYIHVNEFNEFATYQIARMSKKSHIPFVFYQGMYNQFAGKVYSLYQFLYDLFCLNTVKKHAAMNLAKTTYAKQYLASKGFKNTTILPVGLDVERLNEKTQVSDSLATTLNNINNEHKVVLYVGNFEPRRNIKLLLTIAEKLKNEKITFIYVGQGELFDFASKVKQDLQLENLILPGKLEQSSLPFLYKKADLFLLASDYEIYGMVLLEAMYFSTAVMSTPNAGSVDFVSSKTGRLMQSKESIDWCNTIKELIETPELLANMGASAKEYIDDNLLWDKIADSYINSIMLPTIAAAKALQDKV